jgi:hypothetical protein
VTCPLFSVVQEENFSDPEAVHVHHPEAVKTRIPFMGKRYRVNKEKGRADHRRGERSRKPAAVVAILPSAPPLADAEDRSRSRPPVGGTEDRAASLARGLTRLIVALPAANGGDSAAVGGESRGAAAGRSQSAHAERHDRSVSPLAKVRRHQNSNRLHSKDDKSSKSPLAHMKRLSKSATTLSKSFEKLNSTNEEGEDRKRKRRRRSKSPDKSAGKKGNEAEPPKDGSKEVTIAKLGPFKMSLELRGDPGGRVKEAASAAASGLAQKAKSGGGGDKEKLEKEKQQQQQTQRRRQKTSAAGNDKKEGRRKQEKEGSEETDPKDGKKAEIVPEAAALLEASTGGVASKRKKSSKSKADLIIVSKLAKSDRPRRESVQQPAEAAVSSDDYRLTLNKRKQTSSGPVKYSRSVSQPNPPSSSSSEFVLSELIATGSSELGRKPAATARSGGSGGPSARLLASKKHASLSQSDRVGAVIAKQLRRSSTARESTGAPLSACRDEGDSSFQVVVFDNPGFDTSPDLLRRRSCTEQAEQDSSWQELRDHLLEGGVVASTAGEPRRRGLLSPRQQQPSSYSLMERQSSSSSSSSLSETEDSSEDNKRRSPPTQTQSLSEGSSEEVGRWGRGRRGGRVASPPRPRHFDSDSDDLSDLGNFKSACIYAEPRRKRVSKSFCDLYL